MHRVSSALSFVGGVHIGLELAAWHKFEMVWLYRSPIPVGRRGIFIARSDDLASLRCAYRKAGGGGGGQHPVCQPMQYCPESTVLLLRA
jgi:hypothetical protein